MVFLTLCFTRTAATLLPASVWRGVLARGKRSKEIALHLGITENTVKGHLASIYGKLGVDSRASAVAIALERGLLPRQKDGRMASH